MMSVFHICSDYAKQAVYPQLLRSISACGVRQFMYVPVRTAAELGVGLIADVSTLAFRFEHLLKPYHKLLFRTKVRRVLADVLSATPVRDHQLVHAHFLYSDGAVALALKRSIGTRYLVAVRNADVNAFMRYRPDLARTRDEILLGASRVVFLSPAYREAVLRRLPLGVRGLVERKALTVPNGIAGGWLDPATPAPEPQAHPDGPLRLLYVGDFTPNKNIAGIVDALRLIRAERPATLTVVGGGGDDRDRVHRLLARGAESGITNLGRVEDAVRLKALYRTHDVFVMPSFRETFGVAYIEALSQGVPIVHSRGQGVDGYFEPGTVSEGVDPADPRSIAEGIRRVAGRLPDVRAACRREAGRFAWSEIGLTYRNTYLSVASEAS
jgi:glycosyltransferase involved in cell wall biosynthesis